MIEFNSYKENLKTYGGRAGRKLGIIYNNANYILKFAGNLKELPECNLSYSNSPVCEYLGSKIYELLEIPVHETLLGTKNGKLVVACKDFRRPGEELNEFSAIKVTSANHILDSNGNETNGDGMDLEEVLKTIEMHAIFEQVSGTMERFWDMFVIDAWIGNPDRNNGNWGVLSTMYDDFRLAPVYDNGNCLSNRWSDKLMQEALDDESMLLDEAYQDRTCVFEMKGERFNPYSFILNEENNYLEEAIMRNVPKMNMNAVKKLFEETEILSDVQMKFYTKLMETRLDKILYPKLEKVLLKKRDHKEEIEKKEIKSPKL